MRGWVDFVGVYRFPLVLGMVALMQEQPLPSRAERLLINKTLSACRYRRSENIIIVAVVISKLEFVDVQLQILLANLVERADDTTLEYAKESLNGVGVNRTSNIFILAMANRAVRVFTIKAAIPLALIRREQANPVRHGFAHKGVKGFGAGIGNHPSDHVAGPLDSPDHDFLARATSPAEVATTALTLVLVLGLAAHKCFIHFNVAHQLAEFNVAEGSADLVAHRPSSLVGAEAHHAMNLKRADALLAGEHQVNNAEPLAQRLIRVFEDRTDQHRKAIAHAPRRALIALPMPRLAAVGVDVLVTAARAVYALGPAVSVQISRAVIFASKGLLELSNGHLVDSGLAALGHIHTPLLLRRA